MSLLAYSVRRLLLLVPTLLGVTALTFVLVRVLPGDPVATILGPTATPDEIEAARQRFGLDEPLLVQYWHYLGDLVRCDFGTSIQTGRSVADEMLDRLGPTLELVILAVVIALVFALTLGIWSAMRVNRPSDHAIRVSSLLGNAFPDFWVGLLLILVFYATLGWAPAPSGRVDGDAGLRVITGSGIIDSLVTGNMVALRSVLAHLALPVITLVIAITAPLLRSVRASALEVRGSDAYAVAVATACRPGASCATICFARPWPASPRSSPSSSGSPSARSCSSSRSTRGRASVNGRCAVCCTATTRWCRPPCW